jgi:adenylate kinase
VVINKLLAVQPVLLNTHVVYQQESSLVVNPDVEEELQASHYLYIRAEPEQVARWREQDVSRSRSFETPQQIVLHQEIALGVVRAIASSVGAEMITLDNHSDNTPANLATIQAL